MNFKILLKALRDCNFGKFLKYNFFTSNIIRKKGAFLYPYKGAIIQISPSAKLELNDTLLFNAGKYKGSRAESYLIIDDNATLLIKEKTRINYNSTIHINKNATLEIGSLTSNVGINFQVANKVVIGNDCMFGRNSTIFDTSFHPTGFSKDSMKISTDELIIGSHVWVGANAFIMPGSVVGDGSIIGSGAYIRSQIPPSSTVMGMSDEPVSSGMMWARGTDESYINQAIKYYVTQDYQVEINKQAIDLYSERVISSLSKVVDYIDFENNDDILSTGKMDSLTLLKIVTALNNEFSIKIPYYEIKLNNFRNKEVIASLVWNVINKTTSNTINNVEVLNDEIEVDDEFVVPDVNLPKKSIVEQIYAHSKKSPDKIAIVSNGTEYSYLQLFELINGYSAYLMDLGLKRGDMILARSNQSVEYIVTYFAAHLSGLEITTIEKNSSAESLYKLAGIVNAKAISTNVSDFDNSKEYIFVDSLDVLSHVSKKNKKLVFPKETDMADVLFTTGTTGASKGIELTHKAAVCGAENMAAGAKMAKHTVLICPNPLSHSNAIKQLAATMIVGGTFYVLDGIVDLNALFNALNYHSNRVSIVLPPSGIRSIVQLAKEDFASYANKLEYLMAATAPLSEPDRETLREMFPNTRLYNHYGCSESSTISIYDFNRYKDLIDCVGIPTPNTKVMFVDSDRNIIKSSKENMGLLAVSGGTVMAGYYKDPEQTEKILVDGTIYTNDLGYIDENGFVYIKGRNDDVINVGGLKVSPTEVESVVMGIQNVADCICIGIADNVSGQALKLLIVPSKGKEINIEGIQSQMESKLESYKVPRIIEQVDYIERTYNGKLNRKAYR